jgi:hypothetical protein
VEAIESLGCSLVRRQFTNDTSTNSSRIKYSAALNNVEQQNLWITLLRMAFEQKFRSRGMKWSQVLLSVCVRRALGGSSVLENDGYCRRRCRLWLLEIKWHVLFIKRAEVKITRPRPKRVRVALLNLFCRSRADARKNS